MKAIAIVMNDYFHDVASATLLASAVLLLVVRRAVRAAGGGEARALAGAYRSLRRFALFAVAWVCVAGVPRVLTLRRYEWDQAVANGVLPGLLVKYGLMALALAVGVALWLLIGRFTAREGDRPTGGSLVGGGRS